MSTLATLGIPRTNLGSKTLHDRFRLDVFVDGLPTEEELMDLYGPKFDL